MKRSKEVLKSYFRSGCRPTEGEFEDLIDSMYNIVDDEISKPDVAKPVEVTPPPMKRILHKSLPADGSWHNLLLVVDGADVQLYRVVVTQKNEHNGRCYICEALASRHNDVYGEISSPKRHWWGWSSPISFRWNICLGVLQLQVRCRPTGRLDDKIYCYIEQLWDEDTQK